MRKKLYELYRNYRLAVIIGLSVIIIGIIGIILFLYLTNDLSIKKIVNSNYTFEYDSNWKIVSKEETKVILEHKKGSKLNIELVDLKEENKYSTIDEILDELLYVAKEQNVNYKLLYKEKENITKNNYNGYKMLYENDNSQAMVVVFKKSDKLIMFTYEATNNYFDILLDSVNNIIYNFDTVEKTFNLSHNLNLNTTKINYNDSNDVISLLDKTEQYEIASKNYYVKYSIPNNFNESSLDSTIGHFNFKGLENGRIRMTVNIFNRNIYEYLDKEKTSNVYSDYKTYSTHSDYSNFEESIDKFDSNFESYIYKNSYYYNKAFTYDEDFNSSYTSEIRENIKLVYALDKNHILIIEISASKVAIPKALVDMIKIDSSENYSSYITSTKKDGYLISNLKRIVDSTKGTTEEIILKVPDKYKETENGTNIYSNRYFNLNYNEKLDIYDYEVHFSVTGTYSKIESQVDMVNKSFSEAYGDYNYLTYSGEKVINNKKFQVYDGGYTSLAGIMFTNIDRTKYYINVKLLFFELPSGGYLMIEIKGNGVEISDEILNELTNFEI